MKTISINQKGWLYQYVKFFSSKHNSDFREMDFCAFTRQFMYSTFWAIVFGTIALMMSYIMVTGVISLGEFTALYMLKGEALKYVMVPWMWVIMSGFLGLFVSAFYSLILYLMIKAFYFSWMWVKKTYPTKKYKEQSFISAAYDSWKNKYCFKLEIK